MEKIIENKQESNKNKDHVLALRSAKVASRLVEKAVKLVDHESAVMEPFFSPRLALGLADQRSTSLALNAELKARGVDANVAVVVDTESDRDEHGHHRGHHNHLIVTRDGRDGSAKADSITHVREHLRPDEIPVGK